MSTVVTGLGVAAPNGLGIEKYWSATMRGESGIRRLTRFDPGQYPAVLGGQIDDFDPTGVISSRLMPQTDHMTRLALAASDWALADAGVDPGVVDEFDMGVTTASTSGGLEFGQRELEKLYGKGWQHVSTYMSFAWYYAVNSGQVSIRHGMRGAGGVVVSEQAGGLDAIAQASRQVRKGARLMLTGGMDSALCPFGLATHLAGAGLSTDDRPDRAFVPFDVDASGHVMGEGGAIIVLEDEQGARDRGARQVYGRIAGSAATFDPRAGSGEEPGLRDAIELALVDAGAAAGDVDVVFADASGSPQADREEAAALVAVFGPLGVPVTAPKTMTGRLSSGGAPVDVVAALLSMRDDVIPPTANVGRLAYELDLVDRARPATVRTALVLARGHGGFNSALVLQRP